MSRGHEGMMRVKRSKGVQDSLPIHRASSVSGERRRSAPGAGSPSAGEADGGTPNSASAETFPRSFKIQRASSADSLASMVIHPGPSPGMLIIPVL